MTEDLQLKYADKIAKILRKAEATTNEAEAETFFEQAQRLMSKWGIEQAMIDAAAGVEAEEPIEKTITYKGVYHQALFDIGAAIARTSSLKHLISRGQKTTTIYFIGFQSDVERAVMLDSSVQIQAQAALSRWGRSPGNIPSWMTPSQKYKQRREFLFGFARGLEHKLALAQQAGREEAKREKVAAGEDETEVSTGMELVIRSRKERVQDWYDQRYGHARPVRRSYARGGNHAHDAGSFAGRNTDLGSTRIGSRRQIGGG